MKIHSAYDPPEDPGISGFEETLTQQQFKEECDINIIMERYTQTGEVPQFNGAFFDDFVDVQDFQSSQNALLAAQEEFLSLPARIRERFGNDPGKLLDFVSWEENRAEAIELGLIRRDSAPLDVTVTTDTNLNTNGGAQE